jgi:monovalent cation/hydrogen antiporter
VLIGLQLPAIRESIRGYSLQTLLAQGALFSVFLILLRLIWVFPGAEVAWQVRTRLLHQNEVRPRLRGVFVLGWTGMRGVVSLAAALALPSLVRGGGEFPRRSLIVFLTFCVICVTLVLQGITLPPLIRALGLAGASGPDCEEQEARRIVLEAAVSHLEDAKERDSAEAAALYEDLTGHYRQRLAGLQDGDHNRHLDLSLEALRVERETAIRLRDEGRINDEILRRIERELDLNESRIAAAGET